MVARVLWLRRQLRRRERWSQEDLDRHRRAALERLRRFARSRSAFYRTFHQGLDQAPLAALPPLTKADLMDNFDQISTDPTVRLAEVQTYLDGLTDNRPFRDRYWVSATSGSSGRRSVIASSAHEWAMTIASYGRASEWSGIRSGPTHKVSMAVVSSTTPWHHSARVAATVRSPFILSQRLDAASPVSEIVARLNHLQPDVVIAYASMVRVLADEQLVGRLHIAPRAVNSSSEVLTAEARAMAARAWHIRPFDVYAATETGGIAAECAQHLGMHLFEDLVIPELVDNDCRPVPDGEPGDRLLVSVLSSRTLPLIRYELTDRLRLSTRPCPCGLPFRLVAAVEGRTDDLLSLPAQGGGRVQVHPVVFHKALDLIDAAGWQVHQQEMGLRIIVASPGPNFDRTATEATVQAALRGAGVATTPVAATVVDSIPVGPTGKRPLVVALHPSRNSSPTSSSDDPHEDPSGR